MLRLLETGSQAGMLKLKEGRRKIEGGRRNVEIRNEGGGRKVEGGRWKEEGRRNVGGGRWREEGGGREEDNLGPGELPDGGESEGAVEVDVQLHPAQGPGSFGSLGSPELWLWVVGHGPGWSGPPGWLAD